MCSLIPRPAFPSNRSGNEDSICTIKKYLTHYYNYPCNGHIVWHISFLLLILIIVLTIYKINIIFALFFEFVVELSF